MKAREERYQQLASDLQQALQMTASAAYQQAGAAGGGGHQSGQQKPKEDEDVIDAEYTEK